MLEDGQESSSHGKQDRGFFSDGASSMEDIPCKSESMPQTNGKAKPKSWHVFPNPSKGLSNPESNLGNETNMDYENLGMPTEHEYDLDDKESRIEPSQDDKNLALAKVMAERDKQIGQVAIRSSLVGYGIAFVGGLLLGWLVTKKWYER